MGLIDFIVEQNRRSALSEFANNYANLTPDQRMAGLANVSPETYFDIIKSQNDPKLQMLRMQQSAMGQLADDGGQSPQQSPSPLSQVSQQLGSGGDSNPSAGVPQSLPSQQVAPSALQQIAQPTQQSGLTARQKQLMAIAAPDKLINYIVDQSDPTKTAQRQKDVVAAQDAQIKQSENFSKIQRNFDDTNEQFDTAIAGIDKVSPRVSNWTAGGGSLLSYVPGTAAKDLEAGISSIKSNTMLDQLMKLKAASPQGASGLGALSDTEGKLLASRIASLDQAQSPEQLKENLSLLKKSIQDSKQRLKTAYDTDQKIYGSVGATPQQKSPLGQLTASPLAHLSTQQLLQLRQQRSQQ